MNSVLKHALLVNVGKLFEESAMALGICLLVLHMLVPDSVGSDFAKLFSSHPDQHRGKGSATKQHGFPT